MTRKSKRQRKREVTTSCVQPSLFERSFFGDADREDFNELMTTLSITSAPYQRTVSSESGDSITEIDTSVEPVGTALAEEVKEEVTTSSEPQKEVGEKSEELANTGWAFADKYAERLLKWVGILPFVLWILISGFIIVSDNGNQLLNSADGLKSLVVKICMAAWFCIVVYLPIIFMQKDWGGRKKVFWLIGVVLILVAMAFLLMWMVSVVFISG